MKSMFAMRQWTSRMLRPQSRPYLRYGRSLRPVDEDARRLYFDFETLRALEAAEGIDESLAAGTIELPYRPHQLVTVKVTA